MYALRKTWRTAATRAIISDQADRGRRYYPEREFNTRAECCSLAGFSCRICPLEFRAHAGSMAGMRLSAPVGTPLAGVPAIIRCSRKSGGLLKSLRDKLPRP